MAAHVDRVKVIRVIARLNIGGPAIHVINLTADLDPTRFQSILVTGTEGPGEGSMLDLARARGIAPVIIPGMLGEATLNRSDLKALVTLYRLFRHECPHIVHTHTAKAGVLGRLAARLARVPVVVHTYHGHVLHGYYTPLKNWLLRRMEQGLGVVSDRLVAVSEQVKRDLLRYRVARAEKISVIPLGFDLEPFLAGSGHRGKLRRELGVSNGEPLVGIVGRIFPIKNHRLFLEAATLVAAALKAARFLVVGDGVLRPQMEDYARALGITDRVVFTGWRHDLPLIYPDLDVLVVSSNNEGTPVSAIEAMAAGCPVVATRVGGLPDLVADGETGCLVPPHDPAALAAGILWLLRDRETALRIAQGAQATVAKRFAVERLCRDVEDLYGELLVRKGIFASAPAVETGRKF
jgi:glycosyltransferase involved in cell wall biosynthesis